MSGEFAKEFPKIAGRLALDQFECADPYIERLIEGFAFLSARVQIKLDAQFPRFTQSLLETVYPHYLAPTPSMCVVKFQPDFRQGALDSGFKVPRGSVLRSRLGPDMLTQCKYVTAHDVTMFPVSISQVSYHVRDLAALDLPQRSEAKAALRITLKSAAGKKFKDIKMSSLVFYIRSLDETSMKIYEQVFGRCRAVVARAGPGQPGVMMPQDSIMPVGFEPDEAMLPYGSRSFHGFRLLSEFFAFPDRFMFFEVSGLAQAARNCTGSDFEIVLVMDQADASLENTVSAALFELNCAPAVNLFHHRADRIHVSDSTHEFQVVPDRTRPLDYEVYQIQKVSGYGRETGDVRNFKPFFSMTDFESVSGEAAAYFVANRSPRIAASTQIKRGSRLGYLGSEVNISLVDSAASPYSEKINHLGVEVVCTNRDLPMRMPVGRGTTDFTLDMSAPIQDIRCVSGPTMPRPSLAQGEFSWRLISHLAPNFYSFAGDSPQQNSDALRSLLELYLDPANPSLSKQVSSVNSVSAAPVTRRVASDGSIAFAKGLEIRVRIAESGFAGVGAFLFGAVLEQFFARYVTINSFTETVVETEERGEIMRWKARLGRRGRI